MPEAFRPPLQEIALAEACPIGPLGSRPGAFITMRADQWDDLLVSSYASGFVLLELNESGQPGKAYRKGAAAEPSCILIDHAAVKVSRPLVRKVTFNRDAEGRIEGFEETHHGR